MVTSIYFSPGGTTAVIAKQIVSNISDNIQTLNLLTENMKEEIYFTPSDILIVTMPVFAGRIPGVCVELLKKLRGVTTPAIAAVVYGNRAYEDALLELTDTLIENGFIIAGAGAFIARHSIFPKVAKNRPDNADLDKINEFSLRCAAEIEHGVTESVSVPGNKPYRTAGSALPFFPSASSRCNSCGTCVKLCPVNAIPAANPRKTDEKKCVNCTTCIYVCPHSARKYRGIKYLLGSKSFAKKYRLRLEPEYFFKK
ncbi:MAG: 4Fe-4S binding protein [Lachnospiraceae bacterium]